ncbi:LysR family transcriptional regulator [Trinickia sp. Y13]|jgi:DNA-binding transcriptional LysR family regulator|uniref:LysR family transcriptional regulator n=1 Tax=Trinickia sp. Y13 TaxID=2917807 RepID=UPI002405A586|nr:LysR family transcriptional regulator [Trinickia sp. Y13]MDG0027390.1 LysR family transcriptional regulator [Trinickia sp. Y13]
MKVLDLDAVRAFVHVADLNSFTRAADLLGTTQSAVSLKVKRLEAHLGKPLFERTPRSVRLSAAGGAFLDAARELLGAHERALGSLGAEKRRLKVGLSEHVAGANLAALVASLHRHDPRLVIEMHLGSSAALVAQYDERRLDAVIVRHEPEEIAARIAHGDGAWDGVRLFVEPLVWLAAPGWKPPAGEPLPLAVLSAPCGVRAAAVRALDEASIVWEEMFVGGGIAAIGAAITAGLAVSALARRAAPAGVVDVGAKLGLPPLPDSHVVMYSRVRERGAADALQTLAQSLVHG